MGALHIQSNANGDLQCPTQFGLIPFPVALANWLLPWHSESAGRMLSAGFLRVPFLLLSLQQEGGRPHPPGSGCIRVYAFRLRVRSYPLPSSGQGEIGWSRQRAPKAVLV